jgi:hypothetical protein
MADKNKVASAWLRAIGLNALFSVGGLVLTMALMSLTGVKNWWAYSLLSWVFFSVSTTALGTWILG